VASRKTTPGRFYRVGKSAKLKKSMPPFSPIFLEETALAALLLIALLFFAIASFAFSYHWRRFGMKTRFFRRMSRLYFLASGCLAILAIILFVVIVETM